MTKPLPNFIYAGTGKAGTTWLFERLALHPEVFVTPVKETNYFDLNHARGIDWYQGFFAQAGAAKAVGEVAHRYLRTPQTAQRIHDTLGPIKVLVGLREPADYALSDYLFTRRNGRTDKGLADYIRSDFDWEAIGYGDLLRPYVEVFGADAIHICDFADLARDPQGYFDQVTDFLGVARFALAATQTAKVNTARAARSRGLASVVSRGSKWLKRRGGQRIIQAVKSRPIVQRLLYRDLAAKPEMPDDLRRGIVERASGDVDWVDATFGTELRRSWYG